MKGELIILSTVSDIENEEWVKMDALNMDSPILLWTSDIFLIWISNSPSLFKAEIVLGQIDLQPSRLYESIFITIPLAKGFYKKYISRGEKGYHI